MNFSLAENPKEMDCFSLFVGDDLCNFIAVEAIWMRGEIRVQSVCENFVDVV